MGKQSETNGHIAESIEFTEQLFCNPKQCGRNICDRYELITDETQVNYARILVDKTIDGVILSDEDMIMPTVQQ